MPSMPPRLMPESLGRPRLMPESAGVEAVTSESLGERSGVESNSSLASMAESSKSLPLSGWSASMTLEGVSSKSLSESPGGFWPAETSADEPTIGLWRTAVSPALAAGKPWHRLRRR